ncbi:MAG: ribosome silencing factor [Calditrichales bacterium]|nr:MAG: ribosome silencing factor [Calditrichales bacterium]
MEAKELAYKITDLALEKKAKQIIVIDLHEISSIADYFVLMSGESSTQIKAIADHITREMKKQKTKIYHREGYNSLNWVLLDYVDVVVHIFRPETREFYGLERLWGDAKIDFIMDEKDAR